MKKTVLLIVILFIPQVLFCEATFESLYAMATMSMKDFQLLMIESNFEYFTKKKSNSEEWIIFKGKHSYNNLISKSTSTQTVMLYFKSPETYAKSFKSLDKHFNLKQSDEDEMRFSGSKVHNNKMVACSIGLEEESRYVIMLRVGNTFIID